VNPATDRSLTIALEPEQTPITGTVTVRGQTDRPFHGWLGLLTALDAAIANLEKTDPLRPPRRDSNAAQLTGMKAESVPYPTPKGAEGGSGAGHCHG
jgi:hypothetical protein